MATPKSGKDNYWVLSLLNCLGKVQVVDKVAAKLTSSDCECMAAGSGDLQRMRWESQWPKSKRPRTGGERWRQTLC